MNADSVDKIVERYFSMVTNRPFEYKGKTYLPGPITVRKGIAQGYTCPPHCGGCCPRFSLDYLPAEPHIDGLSERKILFDGKEVAVLSDMQYENPLKKCRHLLFENGRCGVHGKQPFSCDFELIRVGITVPKKEHPRSTALVEYPPKKGYISTALFGRGWSYSRTDGGRGALCRMTPVTDETIEDTIRKLRRLAEWCSHFGLYDTKIPQIIEYVRAGNFGTGCVIL